MIVRRAIADDAEAILALGEADPAFAVSDRVRFYSREEILEWVDSPGDNLLFVALDPEITGFLFVALDPEITGFLFCKLMSRSWAMLDNFYVLPRSRGTWAGPGLISALRAQLQTQAVPYLSALVALDDRVLTGQMTKFGFSRARDYGWMEMAMKEKGA